MDLRITCMMYRGFIRTLQGDFVVPNCSLNVEN